MWYIAMQNANGCQSPLSTVNRIAIAIAMPAVALPPDYYNY